VTLSEERAKTSKVCQNLEELHKLLPLETNPVTNLVEGCIDLDGVQAEEIKVETQTEDEKIAVLEMQLFSLSKELTELERMVFQFC